VIIVKRWPLFSDAPLNSVLECAVGRFGPSPCSRSRISLLSFFSGDLRDHGPRLGPRLSLLQEKVVPKLALFSLLHWRSHELMENSLIPFRSAISSSSFFCYQRSPLFPTGIQRTSSPPPHNFSKRIPFLPRLSSRFMAHLLGMPFSQSGTLPPHWKSSCAPPDFSFFCQ